LKIIGCSGSFYTAKQIASGLKMEYIPVQTRKFPDGEIYVRIEGCVEGDDVLIVQSLGRNPNDFLVELIFTSKTAREIGANKIYAFLPYIAYARQDARFKEGECISINVIADLIEWAEIDEIITVDFHMHRKSPEEIFSIPIHNLTAMEDLAEYVVNNYRFEKPLLVGPDEESEQWVKTFLKKMNAPYIILRKTRLGDEAVEVVGEELPKGIREAIVVDDIISTGSTLRETALFLKKKGVKSIYAAVTHALLATSSQYNLSEYSGIITTDSVVNPYAKIRVSDLFIKFYRRNKYDE